MIIKIFEVGNYPQGRWNMERVQRLVDAYDPEGGIEAPCVVGHGYGETVQGELSLGWVRSLSVNELGEVWADIEASEQLREWVATRKLGYVSAAIITEDEGDDKKPPRLAHVAFLGRTIPQIATTKLPSLYERSNGKDGSLSFYCQKIRIKKVSKNKSSGDGGGSEESEDESKEIAMEKEEETVSLEGRNQELEARLEEAEKRNEEYAVREAEAVISGRLDELIKAVKVAPAAREEFAGIALSLGSDGRKALFDALGKNVSVVAEGHFAKDGASLKAMSNSEIRAFAAERKIDFETAVEVLGREGRLQV